ncbi:hypothetical protein CLV30_12336 [Haloactinopolyspora alba]|uniref:Uncharacterized protein n=1 Tax=Haloactinopolyspora alba TaxID=648780 RepID=A0A2P8DJ31_9ACTN|nr:hypothetical protein [Haloactinopolyspora alba]PSK97237.1 hypothetical protein CLV30_12336 [Haloactinopolyspora alba]
MSSRASGGALAASLITAAIIGFAGGAYIGTESEQTASGNEPTTESSTDGSGTDASTQPEGDGGEPTENESSPETGLTLAADPQSVTTSERIDLTGSIEPAKEGVVLRLQRSVDGGEWKTFSLSTPITTNSDGTFSTWVQTGQSGENSFRVVRKDDSSVVSDPVAVTVS